MEEKRFAHKNQLALHTSSHMNTSHITVTPHQLSPLTAFNWLLYCLSNVTPTASATHYGNTNAWFTRVRGQWILPTCMTYCCVYSKNVQLMHSLITGKTNIFNSHNKATYSDPQWVIMRLFNKQGGFYAIIIIFIVFSECDTLHLLLLHTT